MKFRRYRLTRSGSGILEQVGTVPAYRRGLFRNRLCPNTQIGKSKLTVGFGDIVTAGAQVLAGSDDCYITMGGGVSTAILAVGGNRVLGKNCARGPAADASVKSRQGPLVDLPGGAN